MSTFKAGDKVRRVHGDWGNVKRGGEYTVVKQHSKYALELHNDRITYDPQSFELVQEPVATQKASDTQVAGNHYTKLAIQPMEYSMANKLDACQHTVVKYITRFRDKNGLQDLLKAKHTIDLLIEREYKDVK